jgi:ABC-type Na+ transport system ATPase subunit NatA
MISSLEVGDLVSGWGRTVVLNGVSLTATPGSTLAVLGRNGAGKTTLFATLMGLTTLHGGTIRTIYGSRFAKLLEMPEKPRRGIPIARPIYGSRFAKLLGRVIRFRRYLSLLYYLLHALEAGSARVGARISPEQRLTVRQIDLPTLAFAIAQNGSPVGATSAIRRRP